MLKIQKMLVSAVTRLDEDLVLNIVKQALLREFDPFVLLEDVKLGLERVGDLYLKGDYFLSDLIMAAEIFKEVAAIVRKAEPPQPQSFHSPVIFGTVQGDIHDIGKNITSEILRYSGFEVCDLGVNVPAQMFVDVARQTGSRMVCLTGLITNSYDAMKRTIHLLDETDFRGHTTVVIGGLVNEAVRRYTGADYWSTDCIKVAELCKRVLCNDNGRSILSS
jgi:Predicted cobalamin binding protein